MKEFRFKSLIFALLSLALVVSCDKDDDSDNIDKSTQYNISYAIESLGDVPKYAVVDVKFVSDYSYEITEENLENYPWSYNASNVYGPTVTMTISFTKRVPFTQNLEDGETLESQAPFDMTESYSIASSVMYTGENYKETNQKTVAEVTSAENWEAYIDELVNNPIVITLTL